MRDLQITEEQLAAAGAGRRGARAAGGSSGWGFTAAALLFGYLAFAVWRVRNNRCPIPFI